MPGGSVLFPMDSEKNIPGSFGRVWSAAWRQPPAGWLHSSALPRRWGRRQKWSSLWCRSGPARSSHPGPVADSCSCRQTGQKCILNWAILHINRSAVGKQSWGLLLGSNRGCGIATSNAACDSHTCSSVSAHLTDHHTPFNVFSCWSMINLFSFQTNSVRIL